MTGGAPAPSEDQVRRGDRAALAFAAVAAALLLARLAATFTPSSVGWGVGVMRFLSPAWAWVPWSIAALALVPPVARAAVPAAARAGDLLAGSRAARLAWGVVVALVVAALPDRTWFVGDFLLRMGSAIENVRSAVLFPQALPLDVHLHHDLPRAIAAHGWAGPDVVERTLGALEAGALAFVAADFAHVLGLRGVAGFAATAIATAGGFLGLFTGYGKAFRELSVLVAWAALASVRLARTGRGHLALGLAVALALLAHRSALVLFAPLAVAWIVAARREPIAWRRPSVLAGALLPLATLAAVAPQIAGAWRTIDRAHLAPPGVGWLAATVAPLHALDVVNVVVALAPLALAIPVAGMALGPDARRREGAVLVALALPFVVLLWAIHPRQGVFRDWDVFAACGVALSFVAAWLAGLALGSSRRHAWVGVAVACAALAPTLQWLAHAHHVDRGLARVRAYLSEPPRRDDSERALAYHYIGVRERVRNQTEAAADAFARAAELAPSPRVVADWATAEMERGEVRKAQAILLDLVAKNPAMVSGWTNLALASAGLGALDTARHAAERALELAPDNADAARLLRRIVQEQERQGSAPR